MRRRPYTHDERARLAKAWAEARARGERQEAFAARHGVSARRVRQFAREYGVTAEPTEAARRIVDQAIAALGRLRAALDAARRPAPDATWPSAPDAARQPAPVAMLPTHTGGKRGGHDAGAVAATTQPEPFRREPPAPPSNGTSRARFQWVLDE